MADLHRPRLELLPRHGLPAEAMCCVGDNLSHLMTAHALGCRGVGTRVHDLTVKLECAGLVGRFTARASFEDVTGCLLGTVGTPV
jgi:hypothetical protein